jgi:hypothetical protein
VIEARRIAANIAKLPDLLRDAFLTRIKYVDLQKCYPVELGEALSWLGVPLLRRISVRVGCLEELRSNGRRLNQVAASPRHRPLTLEAWAFAHPSDQTRRFWFALFTYLCRVNERLVMGRSRPNSRQRSRRRT